MIMSLPSWAGTESFGGKETKQQEKPKAQQEIKFSGSGTGFSVSKLGYLVTNNHVVDGCRMVRIHQKGRSFQATIVSRDPISDLALIKAKFTPNRVYRINRSSPILSENLYVAGFPFAKGLLGGLVKITKGIVSSLSGINNNFSYIQFDAAIQGGNSGGPVINEQGNVIAIAASTLSNKYMVDKGGLGSLPQNVNFGVKAALLLTLLEGNNVSIEGPNTKKITTSERAEIMNEATFYLSCWK